MNTAKLKQAVRYKDIPLLWCILIGILFVGLKLLLTRSQQVFLWPDESGLDDELFYKLATNIANGEWLGEYSWLTLSKHSFYALWVAVLHTLGIPVLLGGHILWAISGFCTAWAFYPMLKRRWISLILFLLLLYLPSSTANPAPFGYITRIYRDNIFPALCMLVIAGMVGFALRRKLKLRHTVGWLVLAGIALAACYLSREDGWWMLIFAVSAALITILIYLLKTKKFSFKIVFASLLPFLIMALGIAGWCSMNFLHYERFIVSDFSSGEFVDAYSAILRVKPETWEIGDGVSPDVLAQLYEHSNTFAELKPFLSQPRNIERYGNYNAGAFYWALREAAFEAGYYDSPQKAQQYFEKLAAEITKLIEQGTLVASPPRKSLSPAIREEHVVPVLQEAIHSLYFCATFQQCEPSSLRSIGAYEEKIAIREDFLHEKALMASVENSDLPYHSPIQKMIFLLFRVVRGIYAVAVPLMLLTAFGYQWLQLVQLIKAKQPLSLSGNSWLSWLIRLGLLFTFVLRIFMISFVTVASFTIGTYIMYLSTVHPILLLFSFTGCVELAHSVLLGKKVPYKKLPL